MENFSNNKDLILDPFAGSGTVLLTCKKMGRKFIGIEVNPKYCKISRRRLKNQPVRMDAYMEKNYPKLFN